MILHEDEESFRGLIEAVAEVEGIPSFYVEKDYWVTQCLKKIAEESKYQEHIIFKGGTALSKVHKVIQRFSEDIDLAVTDEMMGKTQSQCKKFLKEVIDQARIHPEIERVPKRDDEISGNKEFKRYCRYKAFYPFPDDDYSRSKEEIIIEVNSFGVPKPHDTRPVVSLVGEFCEERNPELVDQYQLESFQMHVISKERAFLDKVVAIQKAFFRFSKKEGGGAEERDKFISRMRHLYDLKKLIDEKSVKELLVNLEAHLTEMLKTEPDEKCSVEEIKNSELFLEPEKVLQNFSQDWQRLKGMLYKSENLPTEGEIVEVLSKISKSL